MNKQNSAKTKIRAFILALALLALIGGAVSLSNFLGQPARASAVEAYFLVEVLPRRDAFVIKLTDQVKIQMARDILSGTETQLRHVGGKIVKQAAGYNPPWSFHLDPQSIEFFASAIEVCDASVAYTENHLDEEGGAFLPGNIWCPWGSRLLKEIPPPADSNGVISVSAASYRRVGLAAESISAAFGTKLAIRTESASRLPLPIELAGTTVKVTDSAGVERFAPLFFVSPGQVNYLIPPGTEAGLATVTVTNANRESVTDWTQVLNLAPGLFAANANGQGAPAAVALRIRSDGSQQYEPVVRFDAAQNKYVPIAIDLGPEGEQVFLVLFGSGLRRNDRSTLLAEVGGVNAEILYAGAHPDLIGLDQVNLRLPRDLTGRGEVSVELLLDDHETNPVVVGIK